MFFDILSFIRLVLDCFVCGMSSHYCYLPGQFIEIPQPNSFPDVTVMSNTSPRALATATVELVRGISMNHFDVFLVLLHKVFSFCGFNRHFSPAERWSTRHETWRELRVPQYGPGNKRHSPWDRTASSFILFAKRASHRDPAYWIGRFRYGRTKPSLHEHRRYHPAPRFSFNFHCYLITLVNRTDSKWMAAE